MHQNVALADTKCTCKSFFNFIFYILYSLLVVNIEGQISSLLSKDAYHPICIINSTWETSKLALEWKKGKKETKMACYTIQVSIWQAYNRNFPASIMAENGLTSTKCEILVTSS